MGWDAALAGFLQANGARPSRPAAAPTSDEDDAETRACFLAVRELENERQASLAAVPSFYTKKPTSNDRLLVALRKEARRRFLARRSVELLTNEEADALWAELEARETLVDGEVQTPGQGNGEGKWIDYETFRDVGHSLPAKFRRYFSPRVFLLFDQDAHGRVAVSDLYQYVMRWILMHQIRMGFCYYDSGGYGYLREEDLENYITELIPALPFLSGMNKEFYPFYVCTAVRKFCFFLDPLAKGHISIKDLLTGSILAELLEPGPGEETSNWFSATSAHRVYGQYLALDTDRNGMLSKSELMNYGNGTLTAAFVDRIFEEYHMFDGEMDYKSFLDFVLAMEYKKSPQALQYFWRLLDVQHCGFLRPYAINYFFRDVLQIMHESGQEPVSALDVKDEIWDMIKPKHPLHITLDDLIRCGSGDTIISILTDVKGFWMYDNRESLAAGDPSDDQDAGGDFQFSDQDANVDFAPTDDDDDNF